MVRQGDDKPDPYQRQPEAMFIRRMLSGLDSSRRAGREKAQAPDSGHGDQRRYRDNGGRVGGSQAIQRKEPGKRAM